MGDTPTFIIQGSTNDTYSSFVEKIRHRWGVRVQQYHGFYTRVLPDVNINEIFCFKLLDKEEAEGGVPIYLVFQRNNCYFIAWGSDPLKMKIFSDILKDLLREVNMDNFLDRAALKGRGTSKGKHDKIRTQAQRLQQQRIQECHRSSCGIDFQLFKATDCGVGSGYGDLERGKKSDEVEIGIYSLERVYFQLRKELTKEMTSTDLVNYRENIRATSLSVLQTFPESFRNEMVAKSVSKIYNNGGFLSLDVIRLYNRWGEFSKKAHLLMKLGYDNINRKRRRFCNKMRLILRFREDRK